MRLPDRVTVLAVTGIKNECYVDGCDQPVVSAAVYHSSKHHDVVAVWLCREHGATFTAPPDATTVVAVQETGRTCRAQTAEGQTCGAYATHVKVLGGEYESGARPTVRILSVCEKHAAGPTLADRRGRDAE